MEPVVRKTKHLVNDVCDFWTTECPLCGKEAFSKLKYGPFLCGSCSCEHEFYVMVESWTEDLNYGS